MLEALFAHMQECVHLWMHLSMICLAMVKMKKKSHRSKEEEKEEEKEEGDPTDA